MSRKEALKFPENSHSLITPAKKLSNKIINEYAGIKGGRKELNKLWGGWADIEELLSLPWAILKDDEGNKSLTLILPSPVFGNRKILIQGVQFSKGSFVFSIDKFVNAENPDTEATGVTKDMVFAAKGADKTMLMGIETVQGLA